MTFIDRTNSSALQKKSRAVQENLLVQKFQRQLDANHFIPHCMFIVVKLICQFDVSLNKSQNE
jgi:hypothetical protein